MLDSSNQWVGMDHLAFDDPRTGTRTFRWRSTVAGDTGGELQVSTARFPVGADACSEPEEGILLRRDVPRSAGRWTRMEPIDFNDLLLPVGRIGPPTNGPRTTEVSATTVAQLLVGAPLYVRVVPRTARGLACDTRRQGVGGWVVLAELPGGPPAPATVPPPPSALEAGDDHTYAPPFLDFWADGAIHPSYPEEGFLVIKDHVMPTKIGCLGNPFDPNHPPASLTDPYGCLLVWANTVPEGSVLTAGTRFKFTQTTTSSGGGFLENLGTSFGNIVTGAISVAGWAVNSLANLYEDAKQAIADVVKDVITIVPGLGQLCNAHPPACEAAIKTGITTGLTAMGLPPSLPNWDDLKQQGVDYLAGEIASQTSVPPEVLDKALEVAEQSIEQMSERRGLAPQPGLDWLVPYLGTNPAVLTIDIRKNDPSPLPLPMNLRRSASPAFMGAAPPIPGVFIGDSTHMRIPMVLQPNLSGIPAPLCKFPLGGPITCVPNGFNPQAAVCNFQVASANLQYETLPCPDKILGIYYRTEWIPKLAAGCEALTSAALYPSNELVFVDTPLGPVPKLQFVWKVINGYSFGVGAVVELPVPFSWSGPFGSACY